MYLYEDMNNLSFYDIDNILKRKESYYKGLSKGSFHDKTVSIHGLQLLYSLRKELWKACKEK